MAKTRKNDWYEIWCEDKESMLEVMMANMRADLCAGYNPDGNAIRRQKDMINEYIAQYNEQVMAFVDMDDNKIQKWCYFDLKRRGAIA